MSQQNLSLENRLYLLIQSPLTPELRELWVQADTAYLQNQDTKAEELATRIENKCSELNIPIKSTSEFDGLFRKDGFS